MRIVRIILLILLLVVCSASKSQRLIVSCSTEKFQDPFERSYYPIWSGSISLNNNSLSKYIEISSWGDADKFTFVYINVTIGFNGFWFSINPLYSDIYNPTIQAGYIFQIFHPPRN